MIVSTVTCTRVCVDFVAHRLKPEPQPNLGNLKSAVPLIPQSLYKAVAPHPTPPAIILRMSGPEVKALHFVAMNIVWYADRVLWQRPGNRRCGLCSLLIFQCVVGQHICGGLEEV